GRATAERLAANGASVALLDRNEVLLREVNQSLEAKGVKTCALVVDVSEADSMHAAVDEAAGDLGGLEGVVTSAGLFDPGDLRPLAEVEPEAFARVLSVNLTGTFLTVKYALPHLLRHGGAVVTVASTAGLRGHGFGSGYTASKGGVVSLTRLAAVQYGPRGVRVNCICPGAVNTPMTAGAWDSDAAKERMRREVPLGV